MLTLHIPQPRGSHSGLCREEQLGGLVGGKAAGWKLWEGGCTLPSPTLIRYRGQQGPGRGTGSHPSSCL